MTNSTGWFKLEYAKDNDFTTDAVSNVNNTNATVNWNFTRSPTNNVTTVFLKNGGLTAYNATLPVACNKSTIELRAWSNILNMTSTGGGSATQTNDTNAGWATSGAGQAWVVPNWANTSNNVYAVSGSISTSDAFTAYLNGTGFGFFVPAGATISGIMVMVERSVSAVTSGRKTADWAVTLMKNGIGTGQNLKSATEYTTSDVTASYGNSTWMWQTSWTPAEINSAMFGVNFSSYATADTDTRTVSVDHINVTVYYTTSSTPDLRSSSGYECYNQTSWVKIGSVATSVADYTAANITENVMFENNSNTGVANDTEVLVNNLTAGITTGNWALQCGAYNTTMTLFTNSSNLSISGCGSITPPAAPDTDFVVDLTQNPVITTSFNLGTGKLLYCGSGTAYFNGVNIWAASRGRKPGDNGLWGIIYFMQGTRICLNSTGGMAC